MSPAIRAEGLVKSYRRLAPGQRLRTLKSAFVGRSLAAGASRAELIPALDGVSFEVARGEAFGVVGGNGSGKSTLLKLVAGILRPDAGSIATEGRVAALIELGAGFHPEISGRENIFINGSVLGLTRRQIEARYRSIVEFAGLEEFIDAPLRTYSSGMYARLGFAVATDIRPEILIIDEILSVGDAAFQAKSAERMHALLGNGTAVLLVSHDLEVVQRLCHRVVWLRHGEVAGAGTPSEVLGAYVG